MYRRILVPLDISPTSNRGLHEALQLCRDEGSSLVLLHVVEGFPTMHEFASTQPLPHHEAHRREAAKKLLHDAATTARYSKIPVTTEVVIAHQTAAEAIIDTAAKRHCDLIVLGTHGRAGITRAVLGSVAESVARNSAVPVLLVPSAEHAHESCADSDN